MEIERTHSQDEEDPAESRFAICYDGVRTTMMPEISTRKVRFLWIGSWWDTTLVTCVIAVLLDPLFFYIPTINEGEKCLERDTKLMIVSLVLRSFTDIIFIWDIINQICKSTSIAKKWRLLAADFLAILPAQQVLIIIILYKNRDLGYLNVFLFIQHASRINRLSQSFDNFKQKRDAGLWFKIAFNFFRYILACHILGASWFFFSVQREMLCWHQTCVEQNTCGSNFKCNDSGSRNITKLIQLCPMNPPNSTVYDFGIFVNPLGTSSRTPINFFTKFSYSFWWGVRNISNFGTNLETSTYLGEVWFASVISVIGLLLFVYLIGNNVQTFMQMSTMKAEEETKRIRHEAERIRLMLTLINSRMDQLNFSRDVRSELEKKLKERLQENKEPNPDNVWTLLSFVPSHRRKWVECNICEMAVKNLPVFKDMKRPVLYEISVLMQRVEYPKKTLIVEKNKSLDRMVVITEGKMGIYANTGYSPSSTIEGSIEEFSVYGHDQLVSWIFSADANLISKETVKCHTKVEGFFLTAGDLKSVLFRLGVIPVAAKDSHFRRPIRRAKAALHLDFDPSSYRGM